MVGWVAQVSRANLTSLGRPHFALGRRVMVDTPVIRKLFQEILRCVEKGKVGCDQGSFTHQGRLVILGDMWSPNLWGAVIGT